MHLNGKAFGRRRNTWAHASSRRRPNSRFPFQNQMTVPDGITAFLGMITMPSRM